MRPSTDASREFRVRSRTWHVEKIAVVGENSARERIAIQHCVASRDGPDGLHPTLRTVGAAWVFDGSARNVWHVYLRCPIGAVDSETANVAQSRAQYQSRIEIQVGGAGRRATANHVPATRQITSRRSAAHGPAAPAGRWRSARRVARTPLSDRRTSRLGCSDRPRSPARSRTALRISTESADHAVATRSTSRAKAVSSGSAMGEHH